MFIPDRDNRQHAVTGLENPIRRSHSANGPLPTGQRMFKKDHALKRRAGFKQIDFDVRTNAFR